MLRLSIDWVLPQPFKEQHRADGQKHRPDKQAEKTIHKHAANHANQNERHWHVQPPAEQQWPKNICR